MTDFEVIYDDFITEKIICSKVYAVNKKEFLIVDENGKFIWVPIEDCRLDITYAVPVEPNPATEPAWDSYDRIVAADL